ncbi:hypothetical protein [Acinetobacter venetianus]|nr:hypothetical protein [Acinetobacter venetianus]KXZ64713.1 hypothetical protein AVENLUH7437_01827 [Acinetobacter venetianus]
MDWQIIPIFILELFIKNGEPTIFTGTILAIFIIQMLLLLTD